MGGLLQRERAIGEQKKPSVALSCNFWPEGNTLQKLGIGKDGANFHRGLTELGGLDLETQLRKLGRRAENIKPTPSVMKITLSAGVIIFADDDKPTILPNELPTIAGHIVTRLNTMTPGRTVRMLNHGECYSLSDVVASSRNYRSRRISSLFASDLENCVEDLAFELDELARNPGTFALDLRFYDEANNTDNKWADHVDLFGRLIKVP